MTTFGKIETNHHPEIGGIQFVFRFPNGYGASVIRSRYSYGGDRGLWESAVLRWLTATDRVLDYTTPLTSDVIGYLTEEKVGVFLGKIQALRGVTTWLNGKPVWTPTQIRRWKWVSADPWTRNTPTEEGPDTPLDMLMSLGGWLRS